MRRRTASPILTLAACLSLSTFASGAPNDGKSAPAPAPKSPAKPAAGKASTKKSTLDLPELKKALESGDEPRTLDALGRIESAAEPEAAPLVEALLGRGANATVLLRAIEVTKKLAQPSSARALVPYVAHRKPEVRRSAAEALGHTKSPEAAPALRRALRSSDAELRSAAARSLGLLGDKTAVEDLFAVLPKETPAAASAIGMLCSGADCERFADLLGKLPFEVIESGLEPLLLRPASEVSDDLKIKVVERVRRLATKAATELLERMRTIWPADASPKVKQAIEAALKNRPVGTESK